MLFKFFKSHDHRSIRVKLIVLYVLNLTDVLFTFLLLDTGYFQEANIIMKKVIENRLISLMIKGLIPLILIAIVFIRIRSALEKQLYISNMVIMICVIYYSIINLSHVFWIILYMGKAYG